MKAVITGASKGIGRALVELLLSEGHLVCACARSAVLEREGLLFKRCDVSDIEQVRQFVDSCAEYLGGFDLLVNNAAILGEMSFIEDYTPEVWREVIDINLNGSFYVARFAIKYMYKGSVIVNVSSGVGRRVAPRWGAYSISKFAIEAFTNLLEAELSQRGIRVLSFNPGAVATDMRAAAYPNEDRSLLKTPESSARELLDIIGKFSSS
ncbi:MAG: SDR family oxidoreductase [Aquificaceae bacterium]|nr:SDR family oxidoreductase [Aquificaceae bacterium]MDW8237050.1 SDR family oxidoreductase [Aquificaceae bacterium]